MFLQLVTHRAEKKRKDLEDKEKEQLKWQERKLIESYQIDQLVAIVPKC